MDVLTHMASWVKKKTLRRDHRNSTGFSLFSFYQLGFSWVPGLFDP